ncbi:MAG: hypothetical protein U0359_21660 [Byssovorax sp.]
MVARTIGVGVLLVAAGACGVQEANVGDCGEGRVADLAHLGSDGRPDPCHLQDPPSAGGCAQGELVHWPADWEEPLWLWFGVEDQAPECPHGAASTAFEGHADLVAPDECEACTCEPPTGACSLPTTITASTATCGAFSNGALTSFDPPPGWGGLCDGTKQLPGGAAHALTVGPLEMTEDGCAPGPTIPAKVISWHWQTFARACDGKGWSRGPIEHSMCIPDAHATTPDFRLCIFHEGEHDCPMLTHNDFTEQHVFFQGVDDKRACSECSCGPPMGSVCTATISIYKGGDLTCSGPTVTKTTVSSASPTCVDIQPPGQALGSKSAGPTTYTPGTCQPLGGAPNGLAAEGTEPLTFCCRP